MRASLPHPISRRRRAHRSRGGHRASPAHEPSVDALRTDSDAQPTDLAAQRASTAAQRTALATQTDSAPPGADLAAQRVRAAGGPTDLAYYSCQCGYLFTAAVSTSVGCPHCGTTQAW
jgi:hypothetical protein